MTEIRIEDVLIEELTFIDIAPFKDREELFDYISEKFEKNGIVSDQTAFKKSLYEREKLGPTYMGEYIAIPHGKCEEVIRPGVAFIRCKDSFLYQSGDEEGPVKYIFVLAVEEGRNDNSHLRILAKLAGFLAKDEFLELIAGIKNHKELLCGINQLQEQD